MAGVTRRSSSAPQGVQHDALDILLIGMQPQHVVAADLDNLETIGEVGRMTHPARGMS